MQPGNNETLKERGRERERGEGEWRRDKEIRIKVMLNLLNLRNKNIFKEYRK